MRLGFLVRWLAAAVMLYVALQWTDGQPFWLRLIVMWVVFMIPLGINVGVDRWRRRRRTH